jgi:predicted 3-demethylubiquinone-9 3-methyltransferase (glyoxalase superfamily)
MTARITPMLWFDHQAEEAARFYTSIFPNSKITGLARYGDAGPGPKGSVMVVSFEIEGQPFTALNGGPHFKFTDSRTSTACRGRSCPPSSSTCCRIPTR